MNREIKFRAKNKTTNEWYYFTLKQVFELGEIEKWEWFKDWGQYTGIKDKNNKEIYEGDVVKWKYKEESNGEEIGEVQFRSGVFWVEVIKKSSRGQLHELYTIQNKNYQVVEEEAEVIGNVYENQKLLKV